MPRSIRCSRYPHSQNPAASESQHSHVMISGMSAEDRTPSESPWSLQSFLNPAFLDSLPELELTPQQTGEWQGLLQQENQLQKSLRSFQKRSGRLQAADSLSREAQAEVFNPAGRFVQELQRLELSLARLGEQKRCWQQQLRLQHLQSWLNQLAELEALEPAARQACLKELREKFLGLYFKAPAGLTQAELQSLLGVLQQSLAIWQAAVVRRVQQQAAELSFSSARLDLLEQQSWQKLISCLYQLSPTPKQPERQPEIPPPERSLKTRRLNTPAYPQQEQPASSRKTSPLSRSAGLSASRMQVLQSRLLQLKGSQLASAQLWPRVLSWSQDLLTALENSRLNVPQLAELSDFFSQAAQNPQQELADVCWRQGVSLLAQCCQEYQPSESHPQGKALHTLLQGWFELFVHVGLERSLAQGQRQSQKLTSLEKKLAELEKNLARLRQNLAISQDEENSLRLKAQILDACAELMSLCQQLER